MGISPNLDRNDSLYECWMKGETIEQAAERNGIPISTVGYYFKKFDRYARRGQAVPRGRSEGNAKKFEQQHKKFEEKRDLSERVDKLEVEGKFREARELILLYEERVKAGLTYTQLKVEIDNLVDDLDESVLKDDVASSVENATQWNEEFLGSSSTSLTQFSREVREFFKNRKYSDGKFTYNVSGNKLMRWPRKQSQRYH